MKQHLKSVLSIALLAGAFVSGSASATPVKLTDVTNNNTATNGCTIATVYGTTTTSYYDRTYKVTCGTEVAYVYEYTSIPSNYCTMSATPSQTYSVSGQCNSYQLYKN